MIKVAPFLFRGPRPTPEELIANNIQVVINLESGAYEATHDDAYEHFDFGAHKITVHKIPCSDIFPPTTAQVATIMAIIISAIAMGLNVLIHCLTGKDRTGFMVACFRMLEQGWSFAKAFAEWASEGRHWWYAWWKYSLKKWAK